MMKQGTNIIAIALIVVVAQSAHAAEKRCGWIDNNGPMGTTLTDRDGEWNISTQADNDTGNHLLKINSAVPPKSEKCGCITAETDKKAKIINKISEWKIIPISACRNDKSLKP